MPRETQSGEDSTHVCLRLSLWLQLPTPWPAWNSSFAHMLQRPSLGESPFDTRSGSCLLPVAPSYPHRMAAFTFSHVAGGEGTFQATPQLSITIGTAPSLSIQTGWGWGDALLAL